MRWWKMTVASSIDATIPHTLPITYAYLGATTHTQRSLMESGHANGGVLGYIFYVRGARPAQERNGRAHVALRVAEAPQRHVGRDRGDLGVARPLALALGVDPARRHAVHADAQRRELAGEACRRESQRSQKDNELPSNTQALRSNLRS